MSGGANELARGELSAQRRRAALALLAGLGAMGVALVAITPPWEIPGGPAFFEGETRRGLRDDIRIGLWWMALVNAGLIAALLATLRLWLRPVTTAPPSGTRASRRVLGLVLLAILLGIGLRVPLADRR